LRSRFYHAERILSAIAKFLVHLLGEGEGGLKCEKGKVWEESGEGRKRTKMGMHEKIALNARNLAFWDAPWGYI